MLPTHSQPEPDADAKQPDRTARRDRSLADRIGCITVICLLLGPLAYFVGGPILLTTIQTFEIRSAVGNAPHPDSEKIASFSWVGLAGNGNHCDFTVGELRRTDLSESAVRAAYDDVTFEVLGGDQLSVQVAFGSQLPEVGFDFFTPKLTEQLDRLQSEPDVYAAYVHYFRDPAGDIRCH